MHLQCLHKTSAECTCDQALYCQLFSRQSPWQGSLVWGFEMSPQLLVSIRSLCLFKRLYFIHWTSKLRYPGPHLAEHSLLPATCHLGESRCTNMFGFWCFVLQDLTLWLCIMHGFFINAHLTSQSVLQGSVRETGRGTCSQRWSDTSRWSLLRTQTAFLLRSPTETHMHTHTWLKARFKKTSGRRFSCQNMPFIIQSYSQLLFPDHTNTSSIYWTPLCTLTHSPTRSLLKKRSEEFIWVKIKVLADVTDTHGLPRWGFIGRQKILAHFCLFNMTNICKMHVCTYLTLSTESWLYI